MFYLAYNTTLVDKITENIFYKIMAARVVPDGVNYSKSLLRFVSQKRWILNCLPFLKEVAICNNLSFGLASKESDIDLFFVLDSKRFFIARFLISIAFHFAGLRRHGHNVSERFCLSFFVDENNLDFTQIRTGDEDFYFYYWFKNLLFLKQNYDVQHRVLIENKNWIELDSFRSVESAENEYCASLLVADNFVAKSLDLILTLSIFNWIEKLLAKFQLNRASQKAEALGNPFGVVIKPGMLKFHVEDARHGINSAVLKELV
jgi:hypothetical protein